MPALKGNQESLNDDVPLFPDDPATPRASVYRAPRPVLHPGGKIPPHRRDIRRGRALVRRVERGWRSTYGLLLPGSHTRNTGSNCLLTLMAYIFSLAGQGCLLYQPRSHLGPKPVHRRLNLGESRSGMLFPPFLYLQHHPFGNPAPITLDPLIPSSPHPLIPHRNPSFSPVSLSSTTSTPTPTLFPLYHLPRKYHAHPIRQAALTLPDGLFTLAAINPRGGH